MIKNHGLEALFKIIKEYKIYYFAAQKGKLQLINIDENQYYSTIEYMLKQHTWFLCSVNIMSGLPHRDREINILDHFVNLELILGWRDVVCKQ